MSLAAYSGLCVDFVAEHHKCGLGCSDQHGHIAPNEIISAVALLDQVLSVGSNRHCGTLYQHTTETDSCFLGKTGNRCRIQQDRVFWQVYDAVCGTRPRVEKSFMQEKCVVGATGDINPKQ